MKILAVMHEVAKGWNDVMNPNNYAACNLVFVKTFALLAMLVFVRTLFPCDEQDLYLKKSVK